MGDLEDRVAVANYCRRTFPGLEVINNGWVSRNSVDGEWVMYGELHHGVVSDLKANGAEVRHPDILLTGDGDGMFAVIEIDGSVHDGRDAEDTESRKIYTGDNIRLLVLRSEDVENDTGDWRGRVDRFVTDALPEVLG